MGSTVYAHPICISSSKHFSFYTISSAFILHCTTILPIRCCILNSHISQPHAILLCIVMPFIAMTLHTIYFHSYCITSSNFRVTYLKTNTKYIVSSNESVKLDFSTLANVDALMFWWKLFERCFDVIITFIVRSLLAGYIFTKWAL